MSLIQNCPVLTTECCANPDVRHMGFTLPAIPLDPSAQATMVNSMCQNCGTHWNGCEGHVVKYSADAWNALVTKFFSRPRSCSPDIMPEAL